MANDPENVQDILRSLKEAANRNRRVSVFGVVETFGTRSYGPFLLVPALIEMSPIGGIPGLPTLLALIIATFAVQIVIGREHLWLPRFIGNAAVSAERMTAAADKLQPIAQWMDRWFHSRLRWLTGRYPARMAAIACLCLCAIVPPLELIPFASTAPMAAIAAFGLALLVRDGVLMAVAYALTGLAFGVVLLLLFGWRG